MRRTPSRRSRRAVNSDLATGRDRARRARMRCGAERHEHTEYLGEERAAQPPVVGRLCSELLTEFIFCGHFFCTPAQTYAHRVASFGQMPKLRRGGKTSSQRAVNRNKAANKSRMRDARSSQESAASAADAPSSQPRPRLRPPLPPPTIPRPPPPTPPTLLLAARQRLGDALTRAPTHHHHYRPLLLPSLASAIAATPTPPAWRRSSRARTTT